MVRSPQTPAPWLFVPFVARARTLAQGTIWCMKTTTFRTTLALSLLGALTAASLAACSNDNATTDGTSGTVTETMPPTQATVLLDLSEDAAKKRETPIPSDLGLLVPSPEVLQQESAAAGGLYKPSKDQAIPMDSPLIPWAEGLTLGHEQVFEFQSVNEADPMQTHTANAVFRALVFDTPEAATTAMSRYQREMGRAVTQADYRENGTRWAALLYDVPSETLPRVSEGLLQRGAVIIWAVFQDNVSMSWQTTAVASAELYLNAVLERYPSLAK
jgi:hypothetical protein